MMASNPTNETYLRPSAIAHRVTRFSTVLAYQAPITRINEVRGVLNGINTFGIPLLSSLINK